MSYGWLIVLSLLCPGTQKVKNMDIWFQKKPPVSESFEAVTSMAIFDRCKIVGVTRAALRPLPEDLDPAFKAGVQLH